MFSFEHRVLDNDADGSLGGTLYHLIVTHSGGDVFTYDYGPEDIQSGWITDIINRYKKENAATLAELKSAKAVEKTKTVVSIPARTKELAMDTIDANTSDAASYIGGNAKSLNSLVGKTIALAKKTNEYVDPAIVKAALERLLTVKEE